MDWEWMGFDEICHSVNKTGHRGQGRRTTPELLRSLPVNTVQRLSRRAEKQTPGSKLMMPVSLFAMG